MQESPDKSAKTHDRSAARREIESLEEQLRQAQQIAAMGRLAAIAVHEISNLLMIVQLNAGLLRNRHQQDPDDLKYIDPILQAAGTVTTMCGQLRDLSRPEKPAPAAIDLVEAVKASFQLLEQIATRYLELKVAAASPLPVFADPAVIDQILINLVLNARDATGEEGEIKVEVGCDPAFRPGTDTRYLEVRDNGTGIAPEDRARLFEMFYTTKPAGQGSGLGLTTVRNLVRDMGGEIKLSSEPGQGTAIRVMLPPLQPEED